jgi:hypothetical protein
MALLVSDHVYIYTEYILSYKLTWGLILNPNRRRLGWARPVGCLTRPRSLNWEV